uniref:BMA-STA-1, isoform c n=1 Tax=Brugia malayi TaxID=6279 RepID=A0A0J9XQ53_BRUMA|nr:BMA-STA-1, isoform c [Brugia malayi]
MLCYGEIKTALLDLTKECHTLWEENKDMQGRFVNDLTELHRMQFAVSKLEHDHQDDKLSQARISVSDMQKRASQLYNALMEKRCNLTQKLNEDSKC